MEEWRPVIGYEGRYEVSDLGRVRSLARIVAIGTNSRVLLGAVLKPKVLRNGYLAVGLWATKGRARWVLVHRIVLEAFVGPAPAWHETRHIDGDKANCRRANLEWATHIDNMRDQYRHGTRIMGDKHHSTKLTEELARWVRDSHQTGSEVARVLGVTANIVSRVRLGHTYACAGGLTVGRKA